MYIYLIWCGDLCMYTYKLSQLLVAVEVEPVVEAELAVEDMGTFQDRAVKCVCVCVCV